MQRTIRWERRARVRALERALHPAQALALFDARRRPVLLDSAGGSPARWSWLAFDPLESWAFDPPPGARFDELLRERLGALELRLEGELPGPFAGGVLGAVAYDLGVCGEDLVLPREPWGQPLLVGGLYTDFLVRDEARGASWLVLGEDPRADARARAASEERASELERVLCGDVPASAERPAAGTRGPLQRHTSVAEHARRVQAARAWIEAGEIYQANLAHRFTRAVRGAPAELYARLRAANRAPYMGAVLWEGGALLSASPELLLESDGREARTRPIKGTIARGLDPASDAEQARRLLASAKDRAELAMIVDLERNDLGRVCEPGSVRVEPFMEAVVHPTLVHLESTVRGRRQRARLPEPRELRERAPPRGRRARAFETRGRRVRVARGALSRRLDQRRAEVARDGGDRATRGRRARFLLRRARLPRRARRRALQRADPQLAVASATRARRGCRRDLVPRRRRHHVVVARAGRRSRDAGEGRLARARLNRSLASARAPRAREACPTPIPTRCSPARSTSC